MDNNGTQLSVQSSSIFSLFIKHLHMNSKLHFCIYSASRSQAQDFIRAELFTTFIMTIPIVNSLFNKPRCDYDDILISEIIGLNDV